MNHTVIYLENAKVVNVKNHMFKAENLAYYMNGYAIYVEGKGYLAFKGMKDKTYNVTIPYVLPKKCTMQEVLDGGFVSMDNIEFVK